MNYERQVLENLKVEGQDLTDRAEKAVQLIEKANSALYEILDLYFGDEKLYKTVEKYVNQANAQIRMLDDTIGSDRT